MKTMKQNIITKILKAYSIMSKKIASIFIVLSLLGGVLQAQNETMYLWKAGVVVAQYTVNTQVDKVTFVAPFVCGVSSVSDIDGNVYNTVAIGNQCWMKENLKTTKYANGTAIPLVNNVSTWDALTETSKAYCWYNDDIANKATYGALYTWAAAMNGAASTTNNPSGIQGVCPMGWHLPSDAEWTQLTTYLGGESVTGGKLKETGTTYWRDPNNGATNETGFTALPGGYRYNNGTSNHMNMYGRWWSVTEYDASSSMYRGMYHFTIDVYRQYYNKANGLSVRCLRD